MLLLDGIYWKISQLGKRAMLLEPQVEDGHLEKIHQMFRFLEKNNHHSITDVVPAYQSIAIFFSNSKKDVLEYLEQIELSSAKLNEAKTFEVEVDYNQGLDWIRINEITGLSKSEIIERHSKPIYTVAMIGFIPGFIFLHGLDTGLAVPRFENPRTKIPSGSIGIGGNQTGIYSLESPGGWNIIGHSSHKFFDIQDNPPISISPGDKLKFRAIGD